MSWNNLPEQTKAIARKELTPRQLQVLQDTLNGHSTRTIARSLNLAEPTIRMHLERALAKMAPHLQRKDNAA